MKRFLAFLVLVLVGCGGSAEPATCKELIEKLQANGLTKVAWGSRINLTGHPSIYVFDISEPHAEDAADGEEPDKQRKIQYTEKDGDKLTDIVHHFDVPSVVITQYPTAKEAKEKAGTQKDAFTYGRFVITGANKGAELLAKIKEKL